MSITCQVWDIKHLEAVDSVLMTCKLWTPCKIGECYPKATQVEPFPGFIVQGFYSPKLETITPHRIILSKISTWPDISKYYTLNDYPPFLFYVPEWDLRTRSPGELFLKSYKQFVKKD